MNNHDDFDDQSLEAALRGLRPRPVPLAVTAQVAQALDAPRLSRGQVIAWASGLATAAALVVLAFNLAQPNPVSPDFQLVRAVQSPTNLELLQPVRLDDGSFARPLHIHWENTTHWEDRRTQTQLINFRPVDQVALIPLETY
jgi:hypothetical protein